MPSAPALRIRPLARLAILALTLLVTLVGPPAPVRAASAPCQPADSSGRIVAAPVDDRAALLPRPFSIEPWDVDQDRLLADVQRRTADALDALDAPACYTDLLPEVAERVAFLSPFEFMVVVYYERDRATRDALLQLYRDDPQRALRQLSSIWPSPRAEMLVRTAALFDLDANQIFVNLGEVTPDTALNVVSHEFWHALANVRTVRRADGLSYRTTGFWTQVLWNEARRADQQAWRPLEEELDGGIPTYLMNEAVAVEMEQAITGRPHLHPRPDLDVAIEMLHDMFQLAGRDQVLRLYLTSRDEELKAIANRVALVARP